MRRRKTFVKYLKSLRQQARDSLIDADAAFVDELRRKNILPELPEDKKVKRRRKKPPDG